MTRSRSFPYLLTESECSEQSFSPCQQMKTSTPLHTVLKWHRFRNTHTIHHHTSHPHPPPEPEWPHPASHHLPPHSTTNTMATMAALHPTPPPNWVCHLGPTSTQTKANTNITNIPQLETQWDSDHHSNQTYNQLLNPIYHKLASLTLAKPTFWTMLLPLLSPSQHKPPHHFDTSHLSSTMAHHSLPPWSNLTKPPKRQTLN
jgi:hypothetical protein